jgi:ATP-dependent Clp protease ATP-binding subunit ClpA
MGVTKQAAQKRFVPGKAGDFMSGMTAAGVQPFSRFTPRAAQVLAAAGRLAGDGEFGAAHIAAALLLDPDGLAAKAIAAAGLTPDQVYAAVGTGPATAGLAVDSATLLDLSLDSSAKQVFKGALKSALRLGHNYIGTEHLLLGVLFAGGPVAEALTGLGLSPERAQQLIAAELAAFQSARDAG